MTDENIDSIFCFETKTKNINTLNNSIKCDDVGTPSTKKFAKSPFARKCFNCGQTGHNLSDCKQVKFYAKIEFERIRFQFFSALSSDRVNKRYQDSEGQETNTKRFSAGTLSSKLRNALDVRHKEIPLHVYKMRKFGYPPGWLEEAKLDGDKKTSNLSIFGNTSDNEDGECGDDSDSEPDEFSFKKNELNLTIDPQKIISYEGFNKALREGVKDLHHRYKCPKLSKNQSKSNFIHSFSRMAECRKRARSPEPSSSSTPVRSHRTKKRKSGGGDCVVIDVADNDDSNSDSLSIIELTNQKNELMAMLQAENDGGDSEIMSESISMNELVHSVESNRSALLDRGLKVPKEDNFTGDMVWIVSHTDSSSTKHFQERLKKLKAKKV